MRIVKPLVILEDEIDGIAIAKKIEYFTRKCYKSEGKITPDSYDAFVRRIFNTMKHEGIIEHRYFSATFITDRGVSHEHVRHRMSSYLQESTRYCDYSGKGITFILPPWIYPGHPDWLEFILDLECEEKKYNRWRNEHKWKPQEARYWLPNGVKTEYACAMNLGSWYNFFKKRTSAAAHPQIRQLAIPLLRYISHKIPMIFDGLEIPQVDYEEAKLLLHPGTEPVEFEEVEIKRE